MIHNSVNDYNENQNGKKTSLSDTIMAILTVLVFIGGIIGMIVCGSTYMPLGFFFFGLIFVSLALLMLSEKLSDCICGSKKSRNKLSSIMIVLAIGLFVTIPSALLTWGSDELKGWAVGHVGQLAGVLFAGVGAGIIIIRVATEKHRKKVCTQAVYARVIELKSDLSKDDNGRSTVVYAPVVSYYFDGEHTVLITPYSNVDVPELNSEIEIFIDPDNPEYVYRKTSRNNLLIFAMGTIFFIMGAIAFFSYLF